MVEVQKLRTFYDFCGPRATLCGDSRGRVYGCLFILLHVSFPAKRSLAGLGSIPRFLSAGEAPAAARGEGAEGRWVLRKEQSLS